MKEFKGTKGEWQVFDTYDNYEPYTTDTPQIIVWNGDEQSDKAICDMGEMGDFNYAEELSNAKLIAAAPDLLEALEAFIISFYKGCSKDELNQIRINGESAISKALD